MNWIKTLDLLPETGKPVLACVNQTRGYETRKIVQVLIRAFYVPAKTWNTEDHAFEDGEYDEATDAYYCPEGWYEENEYEETHWRVTDPVTHWCPMTPPVERRKVLLKTYVNEHIAEELTREIEVDIDWTLGDDPYGDKVHAAVGSNQVIAEIEEPRKADLYRCPRHANCWDPESRCGHKELHEHVSGCWSKHRHPCPRCEKAAPERRAGLNLTPAIDILDAEADSMRHQAKANPSDMEIFAERILSVQTAIGILKEMRVCPRCHETVMQIGGCPVCSGPLN